MEKLKTKIKFYTSASQGSFLSNLCPQSHNYRLKWIRPLVEINLGEREFLNSTPKRRRFKNQHKTIVAIIFWMTSLWFWLWTFFQTAFCPTTSVYCFVVPILTPFKFEAKIMRFKDTECLHSWLQRFQDNIICLPSIFSEDGQAL